MKLALTVLLAVTAFAQAGRSVLLSWTDPTQWTPTSGQTYSVYRIPGLCTASPVFPNPPLATGIKTLTYTDPGVAFGPWCYAVTVTAGGQESIKSGPAPAAVAPQAVTITVIVVQ